MKPNRKRINKPKNCKGWRSGSGLFPGIILATQGKKIHVNNSTVTFSKLLQFHSIIMQDLYKTS
jgi:hypothetical protein